MTVTSKLPSKYRKKQGDRKETEKRREGRILWGRYQRLGDDDVYKRETMVLLKVPRCDTDGESETEVTVTSKLHAQAGGASLLYVLAPSLEKVFSK